MKFMKKIFQSIKKRLLNLKKIFKIKQMKMKYLLKD